MFRVLSLLLFLLSVVEMSGQTLKGKVLDTQRTPIPGAYVYSSSEGKHVHSNEVGQFEIQSVKVGDTIVVSFLGYGNVELTGPLVWPAWAWLLS